MNVVPSIRLSVECNEAICVKTGGRSAGVTLKRATPESLKLIEDRITAYIAAISEYFEGLRIYPRVPDRYPFDSIAFELLSKGLSIAKACVVLLRAKHPDEAYGLARSLVECALILRHLTRNDAVKFSESSQFLGFWKKDKNFWLYHVRRNIAGNIDEIDIDRYAEEWKLSDDKPREIFQGWSKSFETFKCLQQEHPLDGDWNTEQTRISSHAVDYTQPSQFVHCSQSGLNNLFPNIGVPFRVESSIGEYVDTHPRVLFMLNTYLHEIVSYVLFGLGLETSDVLKEMFSETLDRIAHI
jgi:hypothetical protein